MKSIPSILFLAFCLIFSACESDKKEDKKEKTMGALVISDATPNPGEALQIRYQPESDTESQVKGYYYYLVNSAIYAQDLSLKDSLGVLKSTVSIPDSATAIAFNFLVNKTVDTNDKKGFVLPLFNQENMPVAGAKASEAYFYARIGNRIGLEKEADSILKMTQKDLKDHPEIKPEWDMQYANLLYRNDAEKGKKYIEGRMAAYADKSTLSLDDYTTLIQFQNILRNKAKADSLRQLAIGKYPKGQIAQREFFMKFRNTKDLAQQEKLLAEFDTTFPEGGDLRNVMVRTIANAYLEKGNLDKFMSLSETIENHRLKASLYNNAAWDMAQKGEKIDLAAKISKKSLEAIDQAKKTLTGKPDFRTASQYASGLDRNYNMYADTYAYILSAQGKVEEALHYQEIAVGEGESSDVNERYIQYLLAAEKTEKAQEIAVEYIKNNVATAKTKEYFKTAYVKNNKSEKGFEELLTQLEKAAHEKALAAIKKEMLNEPATAFTLTDLEGNKISLASLKGKTVILDFWATWCGPCKASFPGMQLAVEKYKDNPNVAFFFVNTFENSPTPEARNKKVGGFIASKDYDFHVLLDQPVKEGGRTFKTAASFGITGIPTKIIIGPDGNVKFKKVGYGGNNERMLQEIEMMIQLTQSKS